MVSKKPDHALLDAAPVSPQQEPVSTSRDDTASFASTIAGWQVQYGRHGLPWQGIRDAYRIWLSEIMLQQTQVTTATAYYERFLQRFPDVWTLAAASIDEVMPYWAGLGYYTRAHNLHRCARQVCEAHNGRFPQEASQLQQLPGIGPSTASAIAAFAYGERTPIMDGNVQRIFARYFGIDADPSRQAGKKKFWETAYDVLATAPPALDMTAYTQGQMDLGATVCRRSKPSCESCPLFASCHARIHQRQHELPLRRLRKPVPTRQSLMLVLQHPEHGILFEKRAANGIWAGLWSLPQFDTVETLHNYCERKGYNASQLKLLGGLTHVFSHFKLKLDAWHLATDTQASDVLLDSILNRATCDTTLSEPVNSYARALATRQRSPHEPWLPEPATQAAWLKPATIADAALPAPVRTLLASLLPL